ncbi:BTB/POZ protein [Nemania sp. FL0031]|nr:BTB/POZ protein [Nemania sp. FL0031]
MANLALMGERLLSSGDYSDLTIVCKDHEFRVHKSIVCAQSPVLAAAMKGPFKEASTNTFHVEEFGPSTVKCMLYYMYTGKYVEKPPSSLENIDDQVSESTSGSDNNCSAETRSRTWVHHGLLTCIADFFDVPDLRKMSIAALDKLIQDDWSADAFCDLLCKTIDRTSDHDFYFLLATRAADHLGELTKRELFSGSDPSDELAPAVLRVCVQRLDALQSDLKTANERANRRTGVTEAIHSLFDSLGIENCRHCGTPISCGVNLRESGLITQIMSCTACCRRLARIIVDA